MAALTCHPCTPTASVGPTVIITYSTVATTGTGTADLRHAPLTYASNAAVIDDAYTVLSRLRPPRRKRAQRARMAPMAAPVARTGRTVTMGPRPLGRRWGREARHPLTRSPFQGDRCGPGQRATT